MSIGASPSFDTMSTFPAGFAQGLVVQGMPILNTHAGRVFWLDGVNGSDGNKGTFARPFQTLMGALRNMALQAPTVFADILMVKQGHYERVSSATSHAVALSGVQIIGLGFGEDRPTFVFDTGATSTITITGSQVAFQNCRFVANFLNITRLFTLTSTALTASISGNILSATVVTGSLQPGHALVSALAGFQPGTRVVAQLSGVAGAAGTYLVNKSQTVASGSITAVCRGFNLRGCDIMDTSAVLNFLVAVGITSTTANAADGATLLGNTISYLSAAGACSLLSPAGNADRITVANNSYRAKSTSAVAVIPVTAARVLTNLTVVDNIFDTVGAAGTATGLILTTDQTTHSGVMARNLVKNLATVPILATAASGLMFSENYYVSAADKSGALLPVV